MTARLASTSASTLSSQPLPNTDEESPAEIYQKALKLLQDPILPVRAHGLMLLRQLVSSRPRTSPSKPTELDPPQIERALVPAILSIFLQSVQDDDSYIYLNGLQGLAAMVDVFGKEVLRGLVNTYREGLDGGLGGSDMKKDEVDVKLRIAEAIEQVIRRCGETLPAYGEFFMSATLFAFIWLTKLFTSGRHYPSIKQDPTLVVSTHHP